MPNQKRLQPFNPHFPNSIARDPRLSATALVLAAYRSTFVGRYKLIPDQLGGLARRGLGKNAATAAISELRAAGVLKRRQPPGPPGTFMEVEEELCLPEDKGRFVSRSWFDGTLDVKEMAALIFLRAGTGKSNATYRRELDDRFQWCRRTAARVITGLMQRGLLEKTVQNRADGTHESTTYVVPQLAADTLARSGVQNRGNANSSTAQKPGDAKPGDAKPGDAKPGNYTYSSRSPYEPPSEESLDILPSGESPNELPEEYASRAAREQAPTISELDEKACADTKLLGWIEIDGGCADAVFDDAPSDEDIRAMYAAADDDKLRKSLRMATENRIASVILSPAGLYAVRWLACKLMYAHDEYGERTEAVTPIEALAALLDAIYARIADQPGEWLSSLGLVGKRLAGDQYGGWTPRAGLYTAQGKRAALDAVVAADGARTLSRRLRARRRRASINSCRSRATNTAWMASPSQRR